MNPICPECRAGKHRNCNGIGDIAVDDTPIPCYCLEDGHTVSRGITVVALLAPLVQADVAEANRQYDDIPQPVPENEPSFRADVFPELLDDGTDWMYNYRMRPDAEVINDLRDVEIMNPQGVWVPVVPSPHSSYLGLAQCLCGKWRFGRTRYQEHYAYAHILGMED